QWPQRAPVERERDRAPGWNRRAAEIVPQEFDFVFQAHQRRMTDADHPIQRRLSCEDGRVGAGTDHPDRDQADQARAGHHDTTPIEGKVWWSPVSSRDRGPRVSRPWWVEA